MRKKAEIRIKIDLQMATISLERRGNSTNFVFGCALIQYTQLTEAEGGGGIRSHGPTVPAPR